MFATFITRRFRYEWRRRNGNLFNWKQQMCSGRQQNGVGEITQLLFSMWIVKKLKRKIKIEKPPVQQPNYMASNNNRRNQTQLLSWLLSASCISLFSGHFPPSLHLFTSISSVTIACQLCWLTTAQLFSAFTPLYPWSFPRTSALLRLHFLASILNAKHVCGLATKM